MDGSILKNIISSSNLLSESSKEWELAKNNEEFPVLNKVLINGLSKTFTRLLTYKVSPEAYQRYSVRLQIIDVLRDWSRVKGNIGKLPLFQDSKQSCEFLTSQLTKNLSKDVINDCDNVDHLIQLAEILLNLVMQNRDKYMHCFEDVVERILSLEQSEKSKIFIFNILDKSKTFKLDSCLIEKIYSSQKLLLIEEPLIECFQNYCSDKSTDNHLDKIDFLFEKVMDSPSVFQLISNQLKEFFVVSKYAQVSQDFIQKILEKIEIKCKKYNKDILDLYPTNLQFCVILLRIKSMYHSVKSRNQAVESLKKVFMHNNNDALILVSHFPDWLSDYLNFFDINTDELSQRTETLSIVESIN